VLDDFHLFLIVGLLQPQAGIRERLPRSIWHAADSFLSEAIGEAEAHLSSGRKVDCLDDVIEGQFRLLVHSSHIIRAIRFK
jgi:hypothetical protein